MPHRPLPHSWHLRGRGRYLARRADGLSGPACAARAARPSLRTLPGRAGAGRSVLGCTSTSLLSLAEDIDEDAV